jgi:hypothetical protein
VEGAAGTIFISYRRDDTRADAGRLYDRLNTRYPGRVFQDIGSIEPGADWRKTIDNVLRATAACVVIIGPEWLTIADRTGRRRIDDPHDVLRAEVASALASSGCRVFPVLVGEANMPARSQLPPELKPLASRHAIELSEQDFDAGYNRLVKALDRVVEPPTWRTPRLQLRLVAAAAAVVALVVLVTTYTVTRDERTNREKPSQQVDVPPPSSSGAEPAPDDAAGASTVGQLTFRWTGAKSTSWQVLDNANRKPVRHLSVGAGTSETADFDTGRYVVVIPDKPEIAPLPVAVTADKAAVVAPQVGQITLQWSGAKGTTWQVLDERTRATVRFLGVGARGSETVDVGAGRYVVTVTGQPEIAAVPVTVTAQEASIVAPEIGQITFYWTGANHVSWQLMDEKNRALRHLGTGPGGSETVDAGIGSYVLVIPDMPEIAPVPVTVSAAQMVTVAPQLGRVTVQWRGAKAASFQVIDAERKNALRRLYINPESSETIDIAPGRYLIVPQGTADMKAVEITVAADEEVRTAFG